MLKFSTKFSLKNKNLHEEQPLRLRVSFHSYRVELYTGIKCRPDEWDGIRIIKRNDSRNKIINELEQRVESIFRKLEFTTNTYPTPQEFKELFAEKPKEKKSTATLFVDIIHQYIEEKAVSKQWEFKTKQKYFRLKNHIIAYNKNLEINSITENTLRDLIKYFSTAPKNPKTGEKQPPHRNVTIRREINDYQRILTWAEKKGLYKGKAHVDFEQRYKGTTDKLSELIYLEWEELIELFNYNFNSDRLNQVRDVFCFCCFSSLRFSDVQKLKKADITENYIRVVTKKTTDPLIIDLNDYTKSILAKYKDKDLKDDLALPVISMAKTNLYLKEIGEILEWNTLVKEQYFIGNEMHEEFYPKKTIISTHAARRTFVINALRLGISSEVIIKWTGHKDFKALKPYVKIVDELKAKEMDKFNFTPKNTP